MEFELTSDDKLIFDTALEFSRKHFGPLVEKMEQEDVWPEEIFPLCAQQGFLGAWVPEEYGGSGGGLMTAALVIQAMARVSCAIGLSVGAHINLCTHNIMKNGSEEVKQKYLPRLCSGELIGAMALTEPNYGSDAMAIETSARRDGNHFVINGSKTFITNGPIADVVVLYTRTQPQEGSRGLTAFVVETSTPGFEVAKKLKKTGFLGSPTGELFFNDMRVPAENIIGEENQGFKVIMNGLDVERFILSQFAIAIIEESLSISLAYAKERKQFKQPIANFQLVQAKLADMYVSLNATRLSSYNAGVILEQGRRASLEAASALLYGAESAMKAAEEAVQVHGGYGYIKEYPVERLWRDAKLLQIGAGTNEIRRLLIARELLGQR